MGQTILQGKAYNKLILRNKRRLSQKENVMKRKSLFVLSVLVTLILTVFVVSTASAATGCFTDTNGHWAETFICWIKDNGITSGTSPGIYSPESNVTRAQMAVFLQKVDELAVAQANAADVTNLAAAKAYSDTADATNLAAAQAYTNTALSTGPIYINAGYNGWHPSAGSTGTIGYYADWNELRGPAAGSYTFYLTPDLPFTLYGKQLYLSGVKVCYKAVSATKYITSITLYHWLENDTIYNSVTDNTDLTVAGCRIINLPFAGSLYGGEHVVLAIQSTLDGAGTVGILSTTFILNPSATIGTLNPGPNDKPGMDATDTSDGSHQVP